MSRAHPALVLLLTVVVGALTGCGGDDDESATTTDPTPQTTSDDDPSGDQTWDEGTATLEVAGEELVFTLELCGVRPPDPDATANIVTLQLDGVTAADRGTATLSVVETVTHEVPARIQVIAVRFEDQDGRLSHAWEAQRVIDLETGEVEDLHGDGTTPLLSVEDDGEELLVTASDADFWRFDMSGGGADEGPQGEGDLRARCRR